MQDVSSFLAVEIPAERQIALPSVSGVRVGEGGLYSLNLCNDSDEDVEISAIYLSHSGYPTAADKIRPSFTIEARGWKAIQPISMGEGSALYIKASEAISAQLVGKKETLPSLAALLNGPEPIRVEDLMDDVTLNMVMTTPESLLPGFSRAGRGRYYDCNGIMRVAEADEPRFDHDPVTGECRGLLIEGQATNLLTYSEQFDNAAWTKSNATVSANAAAAPDGTTTADKLVENTANAAHYLTQTAPCSAETTYTVSFFLSAGGRTKARLRVSTNVGYSGETVFDLAAGSADGNNIRHIGGGIYRVWATVTTQAGATSFNDISIRMRDDAGSEGYTGDGTSGLYIWGAQLEAQSFASSYIPTTSVAVTRSADVYAITDMGWYDDAGGTIYVEYDTAGGSYPAVFSLDDGTVDNRLLFFVSHLTDIPILSARVGGVNQPNVFNGTYSYGAEVKMAAAFTSDGVTAAFEGRLDNGTYSGLPTITQLGIGNHDGSTILNGHIKRIIYSKTRVPNATLEAITS